MSSPGSARTVPATISTPTFTRAQAARQRYNAEHDRPLTTDTHAGHLLSGQDDLDRHLLEAGTRFALDLDAALRRRRAFIADPGMRPIAALRREDPYEATADRAVWLPLRPGFGSGHHVLENLRHTQRRVEGTRVADREIGERRLNPIRSLGVSCARSMD